METDLLNQLISEAMSNPDWVSTPGVTHCNSTVIYIANGFNIHDLDGLMARDMGEIIKRMISMSQGLDQSCKWMEDTPVNAVVHAKGGNFAFAWSPILQETHGHVAVVAPEDMEFSGTYGSQVPMVASISPYPFSNRIQKVSEAFRVINKPAYFLYKGG